MFHRSRRTSRNGPAGRSSEALRLVKVSKTYGAAENAENTVTALDGVTLSLPAGTFTAVMGPSGSGKSTLLQCAAGLDRPDSGLVMVDGEEMTGGSEAALTKFRRRRIGFVFQQYNLLPTLTVAQNTTLPLKLAGRRIDHGRAREILAQVGLGDRLGHRPDQLSGG
ncbi:ATP-binding cassette domain-containing protein, partial [Streptomyces sp. T-3]|nr:ATP-binding cassette domain-containing protein [Streptomyces sp. T-3]